MQILHLDLRPIQDRTYELRCFAENPNDYQARWLDVGEIGELLDRAEIDYYTYLPVDHGATGRQLFDWLDGDEGFLRSHLKRNRRGTVLAIAAGERLANLPWELLHDEKGFLVNRRPKVVPVRWVRGG